MTSFQCYAWTDRGRRPEEPDNAAKTAEAATEWFRRVLESAGLRSDRRVMYALADLRDGRSVLMEENTPDGGFLRAEITPRNAVE